MTQPLLSRADLHEHLQEMGLLQQSAGILPDNLFWVVYKHDFRDSRVPHCLWVVTNMDPPVNNLASGWTNDPDRAYEQVLAYVHTWLGSEMSFASLRERNRVKSGANDDPEDGTTALTGATTEDSARRLGSATINRFIDQMINRGIDQIPGMTS